jgi:hypothetical protein
MSEMCNTNLMPLDELNKLNKTIAELKARSPKREKTPRTSRTHDLVKEFQKQKKSSPAVPEVVPAAAEADTDGADTSDWRSLIKIHPAADLFPPMGPDELRTLGEDIKANGLHRHIIFWSEKGECPIHDPKSRKRAVLLDGRNRLDAMALAGIEIKFDETLLHTVYQGDPYAYVVSANIHRRHLTTAQKSELIEKLLKADPTKSDRAIAATAKVDHKTVGTKRAALKAGGEIPQVGERAGRDGKTYKQPAKPAESSVDPTDDPAPLPEPLAGMVEQYKKLDTDALAKIGEAYVEEKVAEDWTAPPAAANVPVVDDVNAYLPTLMNVADALAQLVGKDAKRERAVGMLRRAHAAIQDAFGG